MAHRLATLLLPQLANFDLTGRLQLVCLNLHRAEEFVAQLNLVTLELLPHRSRIKSTIYQTGIFSFFPKDDQATVEGQLALSLF